jgi:hypothetical protein
MPYQSVLHAVETKPNRTSISTNLYVLAGVQPVDTDIRLYNLGKFTLATVGMQAASNIGELWVSYDIEFFKPQLLDAGDSNVYAHYSTSGDHAITTIGSVSPFGQASSVPNGGYGLNMVPSTGSTDIISFAQSYDASRLPGAAYWYDEIVFKNPGTYYLNCVWGNTTVSPPSGPFPDMENTYGSVIVGQLFANWTAGPYFCSTATPSSFSGTATLSTVVQIDVAGGKVRVLVTPDATSDPTTWWNCFSDVVVIPIPNYFQQKYSRIETLERRLENLLKIDNQHIPSTPEEEKYTSVSMSESTVLARALSKLSSRM